MKKLIYSACLVALGCVVQAQTATSTQVEAYSFKGAGYRLF
jgi:hypothetical protein